MRFAFETCVGLALLSLAAIVHADEGGDGILIAPEAIAWKDGPPSLAKGSKMAVLEGDPTKPGPFVLRIKMPDGFRIMPHTHPKDERVTVIAGTLFLGHGAKFDEKAGKALPSGSYGLTKADMKHFGWVQGETILQLHGEGPWAVIYVDPKDDPRNKSAER